jgi:hypothetical protein
MKIFAQDGSQIRCDADQAELLLANGYTRNAPKVAPETDEEIKPEKKDKKSK